MTFVPRAQAQFALQALVALLSLAVCRPASACGGFFCSRTPIDQSAERILFTVNGDSTITAYVQIQYAGDRDDFAWVVPVPSVPTLDTFPRLAFQALDLATQPAYRTYCGQTFLAQGGSQVADHSVTVYNQQAVGPFDTATIGGDSAADLVAWLQNNGYRVSDAMLPFINFYVRDKMLFLAMKLSPDANVSDIEPVVMTYEGTEPMIPLRLTAIAAKPELGVLAFILADRRYGPRNYAEITISDDLIHFSEIRGSNNYLSVVSREIDRRGGHAFVTEYAHATSDLVMQLQNAFVPPGNTDAMKANDALLGLLQKFPYLTRLYTRISPDEMTVDPVFVPSSSQVDVSNVHDGTSNHPCDAPSPCSMTYCGTHGRCLPVDATRDGCYCDPGSTAMSTPTFGSSPAVYCEPTSIDVLSTADAGVDESPCRSFDCGLGTCTLVNGNPTCQCSPGHVATIVPDNSSAASVVRCVSQVQAALDAGIGFFDTPPAGSGAAGAGAAALDAGTSAGDGGGERSNAVLNTARGAGCGCEVPVGTGAGGRAACALGLIAALLAVWRARPKKTR